MISPIIAFFVVFDAALFIAKLSPPSEKYTAWFEINYRKGEKATSEEIIAEELYDYQEDALETKNLIGEPSYAEAKGDLVALLNEYLQNN